METTRLNHAQTTQKHAAWFEDAYREPRNHAVSAKHALTTRLTKVWPTYEASERPTRLVFETVQKVAA